MTLLEAFEQVPEFRRRSGLRHSLPVVLCCTVLSFLNGSLSWRDHEAFVKRHRSILLRRLHLSKDRLPSYSTFRRVLIGLDFDQLSAAFVRWARLHVGIVEGEWLSIDGKSVRGTATNPGDPQQNFLSLVSLYAQKRGVMLEANAYENKKKSEAHVVELLLAEAPIRGAGVSLDALHCRKKKKLVRSPAPPAPTT
jgi:DDE_Tnp_1-associated